jgi:hypothetical protein
MKGKHRVSREVRRARHEVRRAFQPHPVRACCAGCVRAVGRACWHGLVTYGWLVSAGYSVAYSDAQGTVSGSVTVTESESVTVSHD